MRFQRLRLPRDPGCPLCGESPTIRTLTEAAFVCAAPANRPDDALPWLSVAASQQRPALRWVDIRTSAEFAAGHVPGAIHAPLDQLEAWAAQVGLHARSCCSIASRAGERCRRITGSRARCKGGFRCFRAAMKPGCRTRARRLRRLLIHTANASCPLARE
jgi:hypothetical protein